jgi:hypothetical protein
MTADINLLVFNHDFIKGLQRERNILASDIKLKFKGFDTPKTYTSLYRDLGSMVKYHPQMSLSSEARKCLSGDCSEIEEILITNKNFPFYNEFHVYNITGTIRIVDKVRLNELNNDFYTAEIQRYKKMLIKVFSNYRLKWAAYKAKVDECYVQSCYVDDYYNCGIEIPRTTEKFVYPDLFIDAGPDVEIWWPTWLNLQSSPLDSLITQQGPTHTGTQSSREWIISDDDSSNELKIEVLDDSVLLPVIKRDLVKEKINFDQDITMTMKVVWPWITLYDTRRVIIHYFDNSFFKTLEQDCKLLIDQLEDKIKDCEIIKGQLDEWTATTDILEGKWLDCIDPPKIERKQIIEGIFEFSGSGKLEPFEPEPPSISGPPVLTGTEECDNIYYDWLRANKYLTHYGTEYEDCVESMNLLQTEVDDCKSLIDDLITSGGGSSITYTD